MGETEQERGATDPDAGVWLVCPVCGMTVEFESCHTRCPRCRTLIESCSDGGRQPAAG